MREAHFTLVFMEERSLHFQPLQRSPETRLQSHPLTCGIEWLVVWPGLPWKQKARFASQGCVPGRLCYSHCCSRSWGLEVDGNYCLTCGSDKSLKLWNPNKRTLLKTYSGHGYEVLDAAGSFDNSHLCSCGGDKTVILWDVATGQVIRKFRGHAGKVNCVEFNEEATVILSGSIDSSVRCWDCRSRRPDPIQILDEAKDGISSLKVSDHEILTGSVDGRVRRYDIRAGELYSDYVGSPITCVCFSKDGQCTLSASLDSALRLLDKDTGELLGEYTGHKNVTYKMDCCLSERDTHVGSCSEDGKVYFWDLVEGSLALTLPVSNTAVQSLSFHPAESCLLTASEGLVQLWREESYVAEEGLVAHL